MVTRSVTSLTAASEAWGDGTRQYTSAELAKGINLAADFLDNPFSEPFRRCEEVMLKQQVFETILTRRLLHNIPEYLRYVPDAKEDIDNLIEKLRQKDKEMAAASSASVVGVRHSIKIEITNIPSKGVQ
jgi:hypothetical protein